MSDDPTNGELARRIDSGFGDLKEDMRTLAARLDSKVDNSYLTLQLAMYEERTNAIALRVAAVEEARDREAQQRQTDQREAELRRAADRRLILTSLVVPLLLLLLQVYLASKGSS